MRLTPLALPGGNLDRLHHAQAARRADADAAAGYASHMARALDRRLPVGERRTAARLAMDAARAAQARNRLAPIDMTEIDTA